MRGTKKKLHAHMQGVCQEQNMPKLKRETRIKREYQRLLNIYSELPPKQLELLDGLIQNAAFMKVSLDDMQVDINKQGATDEYKNGREQFGTKASATISAYNSMIKNYNATMNELDKKVPAEKLGGRLEALLND